ncbi:MAG: elongation factor P [Planctomycetota bacterium]|jgi:elongation factor P
MYSTSDLKRGLIIEIDAAPYLVESVQVSSPTARGGNTIHKARLRNLISKQISDRSFRGGDTFAVPDVDRRPTQYMYSDPEAFHFMDAESYEQFSISKTDLEWESKFLIEGIEDLRAVYYNGAPIGLELPNTIDLEVSETSPAVKGNSATGRTKPATLETGHVVQMPEHIDQGTKVSVDTRTGEYLGRAKT